MAGKASASDETLDRLKAGALRFRTDVYPDRAELYANAASEPQRPHTLLIACADSRVNPNEITGSGPGDVFVTRNIGNMAPAYGEMLGGVSAVIEFAVRLLGVRHIAVCGHSDCGAMKALLQPESVSSLPAVTNWLKNAHAAVPMAEAVLSRSHRGELDLLRTLTEQNVLLQMQHLRTHPSVAGALAREALTLSGWVYEIGSGEVRIASGDQTAFEPISRISPPA